MSITAEQAIDIYCDKTGWCDKSRVEAVEKADRFLVWLKNRYGKRAYDAEVEVFFDGRIIHWQSGRYNEIEQLQ